MKTRLKNWLPIMLFICALTAMAPKWAMAAGTLSGTDISNKATLNYKVGGIDQTSVDSNTVTFKVDNKVNVTVTNTGGATVVSGSTRQALAFTVVNTGNTAQRYALSTSHVSGITLTNVAIYKDNNADGQWDAGDTLYADAGTFGDVAPDGELKILVVGDVPLSATNGQTAVYNLVATTVNAGTTTETTQTAGADDPNTVDVVFADVNGSDDNNRDGKHSARGTYTVQTAALAVAKTAAVYSDPFNGTTDPKAIPGAVVTYTITITNNGAASATDVAITDSLDTEITAGRLAFKTQFNDGANSCTAENGIVVNGTCYTNADDGGTPAVKFSSNTVTVGGLTINSGGGSATVKFQVVIQ